MENSVAGLAPGAVIALRARLVPPPPAAAQGAYDYSSVAWFGATGKALDPVKLLSPAPTGGPSEWLADARIALTANILTKLPPGPAGAALVTGDMGAVSQDDNDASRLSGIAHLLSVSGLHVTAAVGATMVLALRLLALWPRLALRAPLLLIAAGCGAVMGIAYTLLTGAEVPTVRSLVAALVVLAGVALGREARTLRLVAAGALLCVAFWSESAARLAPVGHAQRLSDRSRGDGARLCGCRHRGERPAPAGLVSPALAESGRDFAREDRRTRDPPRHPGGHPRGGVAGRAPLGHGRARP